MEDGMTIPGGALKAGPNPGAGICGTGDGGAFASHATLASCVFRARMIRSSSHGGCWNGGGVGAAAGMACAVACALAPVVLDLVRLAFARDGSLEREKRTLELPRAALLAPGVVPSAGACAAAVLEVDVELAATPEGSAVALLLFAVACCRRSCSINCCCLLSVSLLLLISSSFSFIS